jgi:hypothetical protein
VGPIGGEIMKKEASVVDKVIKDSQNRFISSKMP